MAYRKILWTVFILALFLIHVPTNAQSPQLSVIGNNIGVTEISKSELISCFKAKKLYWDNKVPVTICLPGSKSEYAQEIYSTIYDKSVRDVQKFWLSLVFQGRAKSPVFFDSNQEMLDYIAKTPGAIGVMKTSSQLKIPSQYILKLL